MPALPPIVVIESIFPGASRYKVTLYIGKGKRRKQYWVDPTDGNLLKQINDFLNKACRLSVENNQIISVDPV